MGNVSIAGNTQKLPRKLTDHYHSRHEGKLGHTDELLGVTHCAWCVVGWEDEIDPRKTLEYHMEDRHKSTNSNMWAEFESRQNR